MKKNLAGATLLFACCLGANECPKIEPLETSYGSYIKIFSRSNITINNLEINQGSCAYNESFFRNSGLELRLGERITVSVHCNAKDIKEIRLKTNYGDCKISRYI